MSLSLSLSMSMSFSTSSICMYELHCYECVMHKSLWATSCNAMLTNSFAFLCSCCIFAWLRASAYGTVHKAPKAQTKDCLRRSSNLAELGWIYCVQDCTVSSQNKWRLIMFGHVWFPFCFSLWVFCRQKPCHGRSWRRDRASVFQPWLVSHSTFFLPRSTAAEAISTALLLVCFSQRLQ